MPSPGAPPNYYAILEISETATQAQIRDAYKRAALTTHPDRVPASSPLRAERTRKFQLVNDAYFALSDPSRRKQYDDQRRKHPSPSSSSSGGANDPFSDPGSAYSWAWNFFTSGGTTTPNNNKNSNNNNGQDQKAWHDTEERQFEDIFDEMMREEGLATEDDTPSGRFWSMVGGISGGALGFIMANVPGMMAGAVAGNRLGAVRDSRGKSVYAVFQELPADDKAMLLSRLAAKVLSHAVGV